MLFRLMIDSLWTLGVVLVIGILTGPGFGQGADSGTTSRESAVPSASEVDALLTQLETSDYATARSAYELLLRARAHLARVVPRVLRVVDGPDDVRSYQALQFLMKLGPAAKEATDPLLKKLETLSFEESDTLLVLRVLGAIGASPERMAAAFKKTLEKKSDANMSYGVLGMGAYDLEGRWVQRSERTSP